VLESLAGARAAGVEPRVSEAAGGWLRQVRDERE
jgi:hypothetical protein